ncbi:MAG: SigB/SigF/SigG family RNA polymerase sigma factor [Clostridia bacterium]|jgi:RNA polymerase sporulation-specific sigma factor|nr:SigB/SigF/SigG family RNA polymerase sigma factor [Clostridia bacterium]
MYENNILDIQKAQKGDQGAMTNLINNNKGLIWNIVKRFTNRGYETEDIYQIGCMGFLKAIKRFDTNFEVQVSTYAVPYILGEIKRFIRDDGAIKVSRSTKELAIKILELQKQHLNKTGEEITISEISKELKIPKEEITFALDCLKPVSSIYEESTTSSDDDRTLIDKISTNKDEASMITDKIAISELIKNLNDREKQIIMLRFYKDKTQAQVAKVLGITQVQVSRIEKKILHNMKLKLTS